MGGNHRDIREHEDREGMAGGSYFEEICRGRTKTGRSAGRGRRRETEAQCAASSFKKFAEKKEKFRGEIFSGMWGKEKFLSESGEHSHNQAEREDRKQQLKGGRGERLEKQR